MPEGACWGSGIVVIFLFCFPTKCLRCTERQQLLRLLLLLRQHRLLNKETLQLHVVSARFFHKFSTI
uniref:Putative secreted protein n=1 Tax=Anopheles darlingi TaxID=43151 RepID=A0A2M4D3B8_ANODA